MFDYEYDYDDYYEPSELDEALDEVKDGLRKYLNKDIADEISSLNRQVKSKNADIDRLRNKINELSSQLRENKEEEKQKEIDRIVGEIKVGQTVFTNIRKNIKHDCEYCVGGKAKIILPDETTKEIRCEKCYGKGYGLKPEYVIEETKIEKISLRPTATKYGINISRDDRYYYVPNVKNYVTVYLKEEDAKNKRNGIGRQY